MDFTDTAVDSRGAETAASVDEEEDEERGRVGCNGSLFPYVTSFLYAQLL